MVGIEKKKKHRNAVKVLRVRKYIWDTSWYELGVLEMHSIPLSFGMLDRRDTLCSGLVDKSEIQCLSACNSDWIYKGLSLEI